MSERRRERGTTILIVAVGMISMLAMLALAIDVVSLYVAEGDAQRAADAAALAGAKVFVSSGFTSGQLGDPTSGTAQGLVCNGSTGLADLEAQTVANSNPIAGVAATTITTSCTWATSNPQIIVTVQRTGLPTLFARIWGARIVSVTRSAKAEAYNPSGQLVPIQVHSVKPWLIPNCDPACASGGFYFDSSSNIVGNGSAFLGRTVQFTPVDLGAGNAPGAPSSTTVQYYPLNIPISQPTPICPSTNAVSCSNLGTGGPHAPYRENIACSGTFQFSCGQNIGAGQLVTVDTDPLAVIQNTTVEGTECLIHSDSTGPGLGQDNIISSAVGAPVTIAGGYNNPNSALRTATSISRSDSVVTVPVYNGTNLCPGGTCTGSAQVIGFLQLGIQYVNTSGAITAVILNAAGCNPASSGNAVNGGGVSPIPVRLIQ
jgi:hypothetical protein